MGVNEEEKIKTITLSDLRLTEMIGSEVTEKSSACVFHVSAAGSRLAGEIKVDFLY